MRIKLFFSFLLPIVLINFTKCRKETKPYQPVKVCSDISNKKEAIDQYLQGTWKWLEDKSYSRSGEVSYQTPVTAGFQETVSINANQITFLRSKNTGGEITTFDYKIQQEGELTNFPSDQALVLAIYDKNSGNLLNWWVTYICQNNLILSNAYVGDGYPDRIYQRQ